MKKSLISLLFVCLSVCLFVSCIIPFSEPIDEKEPAVTKYTVTFDLNGITGTAPETQTIVSGEKATRPDNPTDTVYTFKGWYKTKDPITENLSDEWNFDTDTVTENITLYAKWETKCIAAGTKITMWDGSLKPVEELEIGNVVKTFDHETGWVSSAPVCFVMKSENVHGAFTLHFANDIDVTVVEEHGFYDNDLDKYVFINVDNAKDYIGHHFYNADRLCQVELIGFEVLKDKVDAYAIVTSKHLNHMADGMLSVCDGSIKLFANVFEYDKNMKVNEEKKAQDIKTYGLTEKEAFTKYNGFEEADYEDYNLQYTNILIGKELVTWEEIEVFYNLCEEYLNLQ